MAFQSLSTSSIFLTLICAIIVATSIALNLSLLITLMKLRRIRRTDKSNYFLTHLIFVDFICTFLICVPSGYGVYNDGSLDSVWCHIQTYFTTFNFTITFHGLLLLSIERYIKFSKPELHIELFSTEHKESTTKTCFSTGAIIASVWILDIFISFIPLFANFNDQQYFTTESQCDYIYEKFTWWLWFYFFVCLTAPFVIICIFFVFTMLLIRRYGKKIKENLQKERSLKLVTEKEKYRNKYFNQTRDEKRLDIYCVHKTKADKNIVSPGATPRNNNAEYDEDSAQSIIKKRKIFAQFKYRTEISKTITFFIISCLSYVCVFPVCVIHFYRTYHTTGTNYDNNDLIDWKIYTTFSWISYLVLILKSLICYALSKFYRDAIYQAANIRGFRGKYHYQYDLNKKQHKLENDEEANQDEERH